VAEVSGGGTLVGFTTNQQPWIPGFPPPYVVGLVAIDEDPRIRLTTNIVTDDPASLRLGRPVQVQFEEADDVWVPLFAPVDGELRPADTGEMEIEPLLRSIRPMVRTDKFEERVAITGVGSSEIGRKLMVPPLALTIAACERAVADAGLTLDDIDGLSTYPAGGPDGGFSEGGITALEAALRIRPTWHNGAPETWGADGSIVAGMLAVAAGLCRHVLCFRTVWQSSYGEVARSGRTAVGGGRISGLAEFMLPFGAQPVNTVAMAAGQHFDRFGTTRETLGWIALNARANAALNPTAVFRDPLTMDDYLAARMISDPLGLLDCDPLCDGSIAVVVSAIDVAKDMAKPPVLVEAIGSQLVERMEWDQGVLTHEPHVIGPCAHLWTRTSLRPADVDIAELYDGFSFNCLSWIEALGFCGIGEAKDFLDGGKNIAREGGVVAVNTHGGQLSHGRTHGMGLVQEAVVQLRGEAGDRQVRDAEVGVVSSGGLTPGGVILLRRS
jgi:acetyl-CoA acetyltransferase